MLRISILLGSYFIFLFLFAGFCISVEGCVILKVGVFSFSLYGMGYKNAIYATYVGIVNIDMQYIKNTSLN